MVRFSRRGLIAYGIGTAAGVTAAGSAPALAKGGATSVPRSTWTSFARTLDGPVWLPGTRQYTSAKKLFNPTFDTREPAAVVRVRRRRDVERAVVFAAEHDLKISVRGGGHSYVGASALRGTMQLDLRDYAKVSYTSSTKRVTVQAGAGLRSVHVALSPHGRSIPTGSCPTVGTAGLTVGGGIGIDSRRYGLTCDVLVAATVVLPGGDVVTASRTSHPDLFWALQGGGGGLNGVVTDLTYTTHPVGSRATFSLAYPASAAVKVMTGWARWLKSADRHRWANVHIGTDGRGSITVRVVGVTDAGDEHDAAASLSSHIGVHSSTSSYRRRSPMELVDYLGGGATSARESFSAGTDVLAALDTSTATAILATVKERAHSTQKSAAVLDPLDGAIRSRKSTDSVFPWRSELVSVQWYTNVSGADGRTAGREWVQHGHAAVKTASRGGFVNYLESGDPASRYFADNASRLAKIRRHYDPEKLIQSGLSV
ncbi:MULTISPECIES: FAD-binding oxidoreductase [unclassified Brachybacterium]|uniref:FAD-binding oxidoreductase n=1 Tax=unclassified Brachybacterium TaxID=2623841 RepID=UPI0040345A30